MSQKKLLILDNYDSFTYNLLHLVEKVSDISVDVIRNDKIKLEDISIYDKIILSPGPGLPKDAGIMPELLKKYSSSKSILGVCLGLQAIAENFNSKLKNLETVVHGMATPIEVIQKDFIFENCPKQFSVGRYHSWVVDSAGLNPDLIVTAVDENKNIMALKHKTLDVRGVQFHPESILSEYGAEIIGNWLKA
ncbi:MAG: aminodeoxychorismate/anthranilate synthase component II [Sphingobacteriaceae bacterium]|nr:aminodeoxychorismate/anthranilate synthase component II [Sphingobacteriaceae bacterium]